MQEPIRSAAPVLILLALFASVASPQRAARARLPHYIVDQDRGPGFTHTTITNAVRTAKPGDFILVRAGYYPEELLLDGKGLVIQGELGGLFNTYPLVDRIVVRNLGPRQSAAIHGLNFYVPVTGADKLELTDNVGPVWLENVGSSILHDGGRIENCEAVVLRSCMLELSSSIDDSSPPGLSITGSTVALYECSLRGSNGVDLAEPGAPGLVVDDSAVTLYASSAEGGVGFPCALGFEPADGGPGVRISGGGTLDVIGSTVTGGAGGSGGSGCFDGNPGLDYDVVSGTVNLLANTPRILTTTSPARPGTPTTLTLTGVPGDTVHLLLGTEPSTFSTLGMSVGPIVVPPTAMMISLGSIPAGGVLTTNYTFPSISSLVDSYYLQGVFINTALSEVAFGTATQVHVLIPGF